MKGVLRAHRPVVIILTILFVLFMVAGCMTAKNMGKYQGSNEATHIFTSYKIMPDHTYYFSGSNVKPTAIIAISNRYILTSADLWTKVNMDEKQIRFMVDTMTRNSRNMPRGFYILDPSGNQIGIFYSSKDWGPVEMKGENQVSVYLPDDDKDELRPPLLRR